MFVAPNISSIMNATPATRRGVASGMASTMVMTGFLVSLGIAFAMMANSVPLAILQAIFAGLPVTGNVIDVNLFTDAMHRIFTLMAVVSLLAAIASSMRGPRNV
jgi:hypothetical protein